MGLPQDETALVSSGMYGFSRNPIYLGIFLIMGASLVYAFSWVNLVAVILGVALHHRIVLAEEKFLYRQFSGYEAYCRRVRRWL
jgi:protein-S-isoprenylcysteine O-methyltransferase Ste14